MGRTPTTLTAAQTAEVETLAAVLTSDQIADYFGISRRTFYALMQRDEEIAARYKRGKARAIGAIAQTLIAKARAGDTVSMIFYLKTQAGWRETAAVEHSGEVSTGEAATGAVQRLTALIAKYRDNAAGQAIEQAKTVEASPQRVLAAPEG